MAHINFLRGIYKPVIITKCLDSYTLTEKTRRNENVLKVADSNDDSYFN